MVFMVKYRRAKLLCAESSQSIIRDQSPQSHSLQHPNLVQNRPIENYIYKHMSLFIKLVEKCICKE